MAGTIEGDDLTSDGAWRALLGRRVTLRYWTGDPEHPLNEAVGAVSSVEAGSLTLITRRGEVRSVPIAQIEAAKEL